MDQVYKFDFEILKGILFVLFILHTHIFQANFQPIGGPYTCTLKFIVNIDY